MEDYAWLCVNADIGNALISTGNGGRLPWHMSRETLRRQVPEAM